MKIKTKDMILVALFAALTAVGGFIKIPLPLVPFTLQTFFCTLSAVILGSRLGALSQLLYVAIGLIGIPVFADGQGPSYIFKPSFGYLIGFIAAAYVIGRILEASDEISFMRIFMAQLVGMVIVYLLGTSYMYLIVNLYLGNTMTLTKAVRVGIIPFVFMDIVKVFLSTIVAHRAVPALKKAGLLA